MSARRRQPSGYRCLKVVPQPRGGWVVLSHRERVVSEHASASEAEREARAQLREGDELVIYDRYHRCHTVRWTSRR